jgi:membrane protease YdiL (CAAX protease family)
MERRVIDQPAERGAEPRTARRGRLIEAIVGAPVYAPDAADRSTFRLVGLELPSRATVALVTLVVVLLLDFHRDFLPDEFVYSRDPAVMRIATLQRFILEGAIPFAMVVLLFRDRPGRYGLRLGDWRAGVTLAGLGTAVMLPLVIWAGHQPAFAGYYAPSGTDLPNLALTNALDVLPSEFLFRGFLMFTLLRAVGPIGVVLAAVPFTFAHFGKPELETVSTLLGGSIFGWLNWRTGSIVYSATAHVVILTAVMLASLGRI